LRMLGAIWRFWYTRGYLREAQLWFGFVEQDGLSGDALMQGRALHGAGVFAWARGDLEQAKALLDTATTLLQTTPSLIEHARAYNTLGLILRDQGDGQARSVLETSLALHRQADNIVGCLNVLNSLGGVAFDSSNLDEAGAFFAESYALATTHNHRIALARASANLGTVLHSIGKRQEAQTILTQSLELGREVDSRERIAQPLHVLGIMAVEEGVYHQAGAYLQECLQLYHDLDESLGIIESLEAIAYLLASIGGYDEHALTLWAGASQVRAVQQITLTPADQERYDDMLAQLLQRSDDAQYAQAEERGSAMTRVQCIAYARELLQTCCGDPSSKQHAA
jgi:tetratricopeptide (TPR) repeat protein